MRRKKQPIGVPFEMPLFPCSVLHSTTQRYILKFLNVTCVHSGGAVMVAAIAYATAAVAGAMATYTHTDISFE